MKKILITGATGFIGSNIAFQLVEMGYSVYAIYRTSSSFEKCLYFKDRVHWINIDDLNWKNTVKEIKPDQLIHTAWNGIEALQRNDWELQMKNFWFSKELFDLAKECSIKKVIAFGSQAEYGRYEFPVTEETVTKPDDAYGAIKILTLNYLRSLFSETDQEWYWVRVFSIFGENENSAWLIPSVISKLLRNEPIKLTACEQSYNYLYIRDFVSQIHELIDFQENRSGIYNLCSSRSIKLKDLLFQITESLGLSPDLLQFGTIPYRKGQNMYIASDNSKFQKIFNPANGSENITEGLLKTIEFYKKKQQ